jgi:hypothetical protein
VAPSDWWSSLSHPLMALPWPRRGRRTSRNIPLLSALAALAIPAAFGVAQPLPTVPADATQPGLGHRGLLVGEPFGSVKAIQRVQMRDSTRRCCSPIETLGCDQPSVQIAAETLRRARPRQRRRRPGRRASRTGSQLHQRCDGGDAKHASVPPRRVRAGEVRWEKFLYELKAGQRAASGRPRPAASPTGLRVVASPPNGPARAHAPRVLDPSRRVQRHPGRLRLDRHPHGARAQLGRRCSVRPLGPVQPRRVSCNFLAQVVAAIELRRPLPRVRWTFANEAGGAAYDGRRKELPWFATASLPASRITPDSAGGPDNCNVCSTGRRSLNLPPGGDHVALVDDDKARTTAAATPVEPCQRGRWSPRTALALRSSWRPLPAGFEQRRPRRPCPRRALSIGRQRSFTDNSSPSPCLLSCISGPRWVTRGCFPSSRWAALGPRPGRERPERCGQPRRTPGIICPAQRPSPTERRRPGSHADSL